MFDFHSDLVPLEPQRVGFVVVDDTHTHAPAAVLLTRAEALCECQTWSIVRGRADRVSPAQSEGTGRDQNRLSSMRYSVGCDAKMIQ